MADQSQRIELYKSTIEECQRLRGWLINAFAQIEFLLGDIPCRAWELAEFSKLKRPISMGVGNRLKDMRTLLKSGGSMAPFACELEPLLDRFERFENVRHFMTHGFCSFDFTPSGDAAMRFRRYVPPAKGGTAELLELYMRPQELRDAHDEWAALASSFVLTASLIYARLGLEEVGPVAERVVYRPNLKPGDRSR